jgi:sn1-specific diacylglycerol lipase
MCGHSLGAGVATLLGLVSRLNTTSILVPEKSSDVGRSENLSYRSIKRTTRGKKGLCILFCATVRLLRDVEVHGLINALRCLTDASLSKLANRLVVSFVYSHDVITRLSLGSVKDLRNAAMWLCEAEATNNGE